MDRGLEVSKFSLQMKQSGQKRLVHASDKSKKGKVKSLSAVGSTSKEDVKEKKMSLEMATHVFSAAQRQEVDGEKETNLLSLSNLPSSICNGNSSKKLSDDPANYYCSTVPRKQRTAIRKRNKESISPNAQALKKKINAIESSENEPKKKPKSSTSKKDSCEFLSKDEEEVIQTLSSLAEMVDKRQSLSELSNSTATSSDQCRDSVLETKAPCGEPQVANNFMNNRIDEESNELHYQLKEEQKLIKKEDHKDKNSSLGPSESGLLSKNQGQINIQFSVTDVGKNGSWPVSDFTRSWTHKASSGSCDAKFPPWLDAALKPGQLQNGSTEKGFNANPDWKSRKRCANHLHICRLIKSSQLQKKSSAISSNGMFCSNGDATRFKKQTFNFLSLSMEDEVIKPDDQTTEREKPDTSRTHVLPLPRIQHVSPSPFSLQPSSSSSKSHFEQQYYQSLWAAHVSAQLRPNGPYMSPGQHQNGVVVPHPASVGISPSGPHSRLQKRENCSSSYDASGHGFGSSSIPLQLLCKDRL